jgi:CubicO group peptidase (beta-lactamase class C family)
VTLRQSPEVADSSKHNGQICAAVNGELRSAPTDLPADALFPIYSITKTLTAICVLLLVEFGSLRLGDPVRQWLPEVNVPATIMVTQLLRHTSGLRDYGPLPEYPGRFVHIQTGRGRDSSFSTPCFRKACSLRRASVFRTRTLDTCCSSTSSSA